MYQYYLPYQEKDEKVVLVLRRFWPVFFHSLLLILFFFILPLIVYTLILNFAPEYLETTFFQILGMFFGLYWLFILLYALISWINYYFDVWIVTSKRIINVEQVSLFERITSEARLEKIQDITVEVRGFFPSVFHFGNVYIQTAAQTPRFVLEQISYPYRVKRLIYDLYRKSLEREKYPRISEKKIPKESKDFLEKDKKRESLETKVEKPFAKSKPKEAGKGLGKISDYRKI